VPVHSDGTDADRAAEDTSPDVIRPDVMLPDKSGCDILREIRSGQRIARLPVMILTARGQGRDRAEAEEAGAGLFMTKPFSNADIVAGVRRLPE